MTYEPDIATQPAPSGVEIGEILRLSRRTIRFDSSAFAEAAANELLTPTSAALPGLLMLLSGIGSLLYLGIVFTDLPLNADAFVIRHLLLGSLLGYAMWAVWVLLVEFLLSWRYRLTVDRERLIRAMGLASMPLALMLVAFVPDMLTDYGSGERDVASFGFGLGLLSLLLWYRMSELAIMAAVPGASARQVLVVNLIGFAAFATVLTWLASSSGTAPGVWMHTNAFNFYIG